MSTQYVGVSGLMSRAEVDACLAALPEGLTLMCGVLASAKSLAGIKNAWHRRYPAPRDIADIFSDDPRCLNLIHYSTDKAPTARDVDRLRGIGGERCHGFQFNGAWPESQPFSGEHVVLQYRPSVAVPEEFRRSLKGLGNVTPHVLIDGSGGRGTPLDIGSAALCVGDLVGRYGIGLNIGVAGGLCAETLPAVASLVREYGLSIDAEGRLRDGDEGGVLNLDKARAYLRAAGEVML